MIRDLIRRLVKRLRLLRRSKTPGDAPPYSARTEDRWSIGIYVGQSPFALRSPEQGRNPVLTHADISDVAASFVADPFMLRRDSTWYMFFEIMNRETRKGEIGLATSANGFRWTYRQRVLKEPFHLSYPYVFQWRNDYYMIPETYQTTSIRLYKARDFPTQWLFVGTLLDGQEFVDSSIFHIDGMWWLLAGHGTRPHRADVLRLFHAPELLGPWVEHQASPIIAGNPHIARPAGRVLVFDGRVYRFAQDCCPHYGTQVRGFEITELTTRSYREQEVSEHPVLAASGAGWNASGMHHVDAHLGENGPWIACVDGFFRQQVEA